MNIKKNAIIATLCGLVGFFSSACGQRGALFLPTVPTQDAVIPQGTQKETHLLPQGLGATDHSRLPGSSQFTSPTRVPTVDIMGTPVFFQSPPLHTPHPISPDSP